jgi:hypothetical protein
MRSLRPCLLWPCAGDGLRRREHWVDHSQTKPAGGGASSVGRLPQAAVSRRQDVACSNENSRQVKAAYSSSNTHADDHKHAWHSSRHSQARHTNAAANQWLAWLFRARLKTVTMQIIHSKKLRQAHVSLAKRGRCLAHTSGRAMARSPSSPGHIPMLLIKLYVGRRRCITLSAPY